MDGAHQFNHIGDRNNPPSSGWRIQESPKLSAPVIKNLKLFFILKTLNGIEVKVKNQPGHPA